MLSTFGMTSVWPLLSGPTSRNARDFDVSSTLKLGISPLMILQKIQEADIMILESIGTCLDVTESWGNC